jgi:hypothetical protein
MLGRAYGVPLEGMRAPKTPNDGDSRWGAENAESGMAVAGAAAGRNSNAKTQREEEDTERKMVLQGADRCGRQDWIVYHAIRKPAGGWGNRSVRAKPFTWNPDVNWSPNAAGTAFTWPKAQPRPALTTSSITTAFQVRCWNNP